MPLRLDKLDFKIVSLLISGQDNKQISKALNTPLSTVQRRTRRIFENGIVRNRVEPNYQQLGLSKGLLHVYVNGVDAMKVAGDFGKIDGVLAVSLHIGNSDVVGEIIYKNSVDILRAISDTKKIEGVERVVWSEEVYNVTLDKPKIDLLMLIKSKKG